MKLKLYRRWYIRHRLLAHLAFIGFVSALAGWIIALVSVGSSL